MKRVKLFNISDLDRFFEVVDQCQGPVRIVGDGIDIDLKSKLAQYFSLAKCFSGGHLNELELVVENSQDIAKLFGFALAG